MKNLTATTLIVLSSFIASGAALASGIEDIDQDLLYGKAPVSTMDFTRMPATAAGKSFTSSVRTAGIQDQANDLLYGNTPVSSTNFTRMPATAAGRSSNSVTRSGGIEDQQHDLLYGSFNQLR